MVRTSAGENTPLVVAYELPRSDVGYYPSTAEYGVWVSLDPNTPSVLRSYSLPYWSNYEVSGGITCRVYDNDGPEIHGIPTPRTLLSSVQLDIAGGNAISVLTVRYPFSARNQLPPSVTITVEFTGVDATHQAGWMTTDRDNTVGENYDFFWQKAGDTWTQRTFGPPGTPTLTVTRGTAGKVVVSVKGTTGAKYVLERSTDLKTWTKVQTSANGGFDYTETVPGNAGRSVYRAYGTR